MFTEYIRASEYLLNIHRGVFPVPFVTFMNDSECIVKLKPGKNKSFTNHVAEKDPI